MVKGSIKIDFLFFNWSHRPLDWVESHRAVPDITLQTSHKHSVLFWSSMLSDSTVHDRENENLSGLNNKNNSATNKRAHELVNTPININKRAPCMGSDLLVNDICFFRYYWRTNTSFCFEK